MTMYVMCAVKHVCTVRLGYWYMLYMPFSKLLTVSAAVLANLCVSYVMTSQTDEVKCVHTQSNNCTFKVTGSCFSLSCSLCGVICCPHPGRRPHEENREGRSECWLYLTLSIPFLSLLFCPSPLILQFFLSGRCSI